MANGCFWGRSITASGACDDFARYNNFGPFTPGFPLVDYNNLEQVEAIMKADPNLAAIMVEPIQGEGGVLIPDKGYLPGLRKLCDKYNVLLITDEVQTGLGRTGKLMGYEHDLGDVKPDIVTLGKAISGGVTPVSGIVTMNEVMDTIKPGDHGSTYGGNPLGMAVASAAVRTIIEEDMVGNSVKMGKYLVDQLNTLDSPLIKEVRARGLFCGLEFKNDLNVDGNDYAKILFKNGILSKATHDSTIRFTPALIVTKEQIDEALPLIKKSLTQLEELNHSKGK